MKASLGRDVFVWTAPASLSTAARSAKVGEGDGRVTTVMITNSVDEAILLSDRIVPILPGPPATLGTPIEVALPRPRTAALLAHDDEAARVRTHVIATLTDALSGTSRTRKAAAALRQRDTEVVEMPGSVAEEVR